MLSGSNISTYTNKDDRNTGVTIGQQSVVIAGRKKLFSEKLLFNAIQELSKADQLETSGNNEQAATLRTETYGKLANQLQIGVNGKVLNRGGFVFTDMGNKTFSLLLAEKKGAIINGKRMAMGGARFKDVLSTDDAKVLENAILDGLLTAVKNNEAARAAAADLEKNDNEASLNTIASVFATVISNLTDKAKQYLEAMVNYLVDSVNQEKLSSNNAIREIREEAGVVVTEDMSKGKLVRVDTDALQKMTALFGIELPGLSMQERNPKAETLFYSFLRNSAANEEKSENKAKMEVVPVVFTRFECIKQEKQVLINLYNGETHTGTLDGSNSLFFLQAATKCFSAQQLQTMCSQYKLVNAANYSPRQFGQSRQSTVTVATDEQQPSATPTSSM